jgi:hypothetical protein
VSSGVSFRHGFMDEPSKDDIQILCSPHQRIEANIYVQMP